MIQKKKSVNIIKNRLKDLNNEINKMSEEERENERVDEIIEIVERILAYIKQQQQKIRTRHKNTNTKPNA